MESDNSDIKFASDSDEESQDEAPYSYESDKIPSDLESELSSHSELLENKDGTEKTFEWGENKRKWGPNSSDYFSRLQNSDYKISSHNDLCTYTKQQA